MYQNIHHSTTPFHYTYRKPTHTYRRLILFAETAVVFSGDQTLDFRGGLKAASVRQRRPITRKTERKLCHSSQRAVTYGGAASCITRPTCVSLRDKGRMFIVILRVFVALTGNKVNVHARIHNTHNPLLFCYWPDFLSYIKKYTNIHTYIHTRCLDAIVWPLQV